jgi:hypothetical protein
MLFYFERSEEMKRKSLWVWLVAIFLMLLIPLVNSGYQPENRSQNPHGKLFSKIHGVSRMTPKECGIRGEDIPAFIEHLKFIEHLIKVMKALLGLYSENPDEVRSSIDKLRVLAEEGASKYPCVYKLVAEVLDYYESAEVEYDYYTRSLAVRTQVITARELGWPDGKKAIESVVDILLSDRLDMMRAAAANALSGYGHTRVVTPLDHAYKNDSSPIVREMSYRALLILTNGAYGSVMQVLSGSGPEAGSSTPSSTASRTTSSASGSSLASGEKQNCLSDEMYEWIKTHTIILDKRINLEELRCSNQKESK